MDGLVHGKSQSNMDDDWGYPYDSGKLHIPTMLYEPLLSGVLKSMQPTIGIL